MGRRSWDDIQRQYESDKELFKEPEQQAQEAPTQPRKTASEQREARAARIRSETSRMGAKTRRRRQWEASPEGRQRTADIVDYATAMHNEVARKHPELGLAQHGRINMSPAQLYEHFGFKQRDTGPGMHEQQIPGLEDPDALPRPKRWEEHTPEEQAAIQRRVKLHSGATLETMKRDFGSQLDQSYVRAMEHGHDQPAGANFYTEGEPARVLRDTARRRGVPLGLVAAANADTSPQLKFRIRNREGEIRYPNAEQAEHAIRHVQETGSPFGIDKEDLAGIARNGFMVNLRKAAHRVHQVLHEGRTVSETYSGTGPGSGFGPKTAAYHNSWLGGTPDFLVSDVHTGGGGMLPHLSSAKPLIRDEEGNARLYAGGNPKRGKSEREQVIERPGFHAMADFAARQAMQERGLGRIRQAQAAQWAEERIHRHETERNPQVAGHFPSAEQEYPRKPPVNPEQFGQGKLF